MKKFLIGCLILITACQPATPHLRLHSSQQRRFLLLRYLPPLLPNRLLPLSLPLLRSQGCLPTNLTLRSQAGSSSRQAVIPYRTLKPRIATSSCKWILPLHGCMPSMAHRIMIISASMRNLQNQAGSPASIGLICRYSESDGWLEYNVSTDGTYNVLYGQWLATGIADYLPILSESSKEIQPSGASQEIGLICSDTTLSLFVNQTLIRNVDVSRYELSRR